MDTIQDRFKDVPVHVQRQYIEERMKELQHRQDVVACMERSFEDLSARLSKLKQELEDGRALLELEKLSLEAFKVMNNVEEVEEDVTPLTITVIINGMDFEFAKDEEVCSYEYLVVRAGMVGIPTMTYRKLLDNNTVHSGILHTGQILKLLDGMVITIVHTDNA